ncbi:MAG: 3-phosphoshikimate 1-carboxyvinyltransferase 1 [Elusimicrobia bacterium]|nr:3-phosphoshikimate 1-carboxyvinyltransferase 1 [Elusimicrobiota bacterium]
MELNKKILPATRFTGTVETPPDKSITHRAIFLSSLSEGLSTIQNPLLSEDCLSTAGCMESLGIQIDRNPGLWKIHGRGLWGFQTPQAPLDCGNSGTTMRLISGLLSAQNFASELRGDASLSKRPMNRVAEPLIQMGAQVELTQGKYAPIRIKGTRNLKPIHWVNKVASAQVKSSVLLAALHAQGESSYEEPTLSRDHTERMLEACGVPLARSKNTIKIKGPAQLKPQHWIVPGDISSAAFFLAGAQLVSGANLRLSAVNVNPTRTGFLDILDQAGAKIKMENQKQVGGEPIADLIVNEQTPLKSFNITKEISPRLIDEIPILSILAAMAHGTSHFSGLEELRVKETDRLKAIAINLKAMGTQVEEKSDGLIIQGPTNLRGTELNSFDDHRIAMSFAIAGLVAKGSTTILNSACVAISFPNFWDQLDKLCQG